MTEEEAIKVLNDYDINFERHTPEEVAEAHEMAIKALEPQPKERTEERTETHACDYISRKLMMDMGATCIAARNEDGDLVALGALDILPSGDIEFAEEQDLTEDEKTIFASVKHIINEELSEKVVHLNAENKPRLSKPAFTVIDHVLKEHEEHEDRFTTFCDGRHQQITVKQINAELDKLYNYFYGGKDD